MRFILTVLMMTVCYSPAPIAQVTVHRTPVIGAPAPDFSLPFATRDSVGMGGITLSGFAGKKTVVLAFYPADWSGGCTREVCTIRDHFDSLAGPDVEVLAISGDYPYSHHEWAKQHNLPFALLSDSRHTVAPAYDSYNASSGYNKRTVFIIDKEGRFAYIDLEYSTRDMTSFNKLREALSSMKP